MLRNGNDVLEVDGTIRNSMSHLYMNALFTADLADGAYVNRNETLSESEVNEIIENMNSWPGMIWLGLTANYRKTNGHL